MLIRELKQNNFYVFSANVQVRQRNYSQWIPVQISARSTQEAKKMLQAQYGTDSKISGLRKSK
jgi:hypothetical protein|tara:strand:- start:546 stop:734 length:189 start_codon:yes stop_codon:yes gene_type:complete